MAIGAVRSPVWKCADHTDEYKPLRRRLNFPPAVQPRRGFVNSEAVAADFQIWLLLPLPTFRHLLLSFGRCGGPTLWPILRMDRHAPAA